MAKKLMTKKFNHDEIRREMDNYINHAKAVGFKNIDGMAAYSQLLHEVVMIEYTNKRIEDGKDFKL